MTTRRTSLRTSGEWRLSTAPVASGAVLVVVLVVVMVLDPLSQPAARRPPIGVVVGVVVGWWSWRLPHHRQSGAVTATSRSEVAGATWLRLLPMSQVLEV